MLGPLAGGWILALHLPTANVLGLLAVPVVACAALVVLLPLVYRPPAR